MQLKGRSVYNLSSASRRHGAAIDAACSTLLPGSDRAFASSADLGAADYNILIVSELRLVQDTLAAVFVHTSAFINVVLAGGLAEVQTQISNARPALVMIDASLKDGKAVARLLRRSDASIQIIAFGVDEEALQTVAEWVDAGVSACLGRSISWRDAAEVIGKVMTNRRLPTTNLRPAKAASVLTEREAAVAHLILAGKSNKDIARTLLVSLATVKSHVHNLLGKLGLERRGQLAMWYADRQASAAKPPDFVRRTAANANHVAHSVAQHQQTS